MIVNPMISGGVKLPELNNPGAAADLLEGKQLVDQYGNPLTGTMPKKSAADLSASGAMVTVPAGYYPEQVQKSVAEAAQATPGISVSSSGLITASVTQDEGYVAAGTRSATRQLTTQAGKTVTPTTGRQTAVASGRYTTGPVYVAGDANLVASNIRSGASIFGVSGNYQGETATIQKVDNVPVTSPYNNQLQVDLSQLPKTPNKILFALLHVAAMQTVNNNLTYEYMPFFFSTEMLKAGVYGAICIPASMNFMGQSEILTVTKDGKKYEVSFALETIGSCSSTAAGYVVYT